MNDKLQTILHNYINDYISKKDFPYVVNPLIPIVWFGDIEKYLCSPIRILTVGLNPSDKEFSECRFPEALNHFNINTLKQSLNNYFNYNPYKQYFQHFERVLNLIDSSYGGKLCFKPFKITAIHADIYSSLATNPTWRYLTKEEKNSVSQYNLFFDMLKTISPNIILISVSRETVFKAFRINPLLDNCIYEYRNTNGPQIEAYKINDKIIVYGRNIKGSPFAISNEILLKAFEKIFSDLPNNLTTKMACKPKEGVFWVIAQNEEMIHSGKFQLISQFDAINSHNDIWEQIKYENKDLNMFDYDAFPRGRVWIKNSKAIIFLDKRINTYAIISDINRIFCLNENYEIQIAN